VPRLIGPIRRECIDHVVIINGLGGFGCVRCVLPDVAEVYDPFVGSATTLIAAEQLGRRCLAIEIEHRYLRRSRSTAGNPLAVRLPFRSRRRSSIGDRRFVRGVGGTT